MGNYDGARAVADELVADSVANDRRREETAGHKLYAEIHMKRHDWGDAIGPLEQVLEIAQEIGDVGLAADAHVRLSQCWLELGDIPRASTHLQLVLAERPADADTLRLQARLAAANGDIGNAVTVMSEARTRAGESWTEDDDALLAAWQQAATN
jgi:tetratricopeptide (TPR) repeat protein